MPISKDHTIHSYLQILTFTPFQVTGKNADCVFWDFEISDWSQEGCQLMAESIDTRRATCHCNHLTNFAVLVVNTYCIKKILIYNAIANFNSFSTDIHFFNNRYTTILYLHRIIFFSDFYTFALSFIIPIS